MPFGVASRNYLALAPLAKIHRSTFLRVPAEGKSAHLKQVAIVRCRVQSGRCNGKGRRATKNHIFVPSQAVHSVYARLQEKLLDQLSGLALLGGLRQQFDLESRYRHL